MSSVTVSRNKELKEAARAIGKRHDLGIESFIEAHACTVRVKGEFDEGMLYLFKEHLIYGSVEWRSSSLIYPIEDVQVESATYDGLVLHVVEPDTPPRFLNFTEMDRPDEVGRVLHFLRCWSEGKIDDKLQEALDRLPIGSIYTRALMRYPQHHHDMWNIFGTHTVLHPPEQRLIPAPELPGDSALDRQAFEAVIGHHMFWGLNIHKLDPRGYRSGHYNDGLIKSLSTEMMVFLNTSVISLHGQHRPMPIQLQYTGILSIVEFTVEDDETEEVVPAIRVAYVSEDSVSNIFVLHSFETEQAFELCLHEMTLAWAQEHNRHYNIGEAFPVLDNIDLLTIVKHFRELDRDGYGIIPKEDFAEAFKTLDGSGDFHDLVLEMFDPNNEERVQFSRYLAVMRTLLSGSVEDKADLIFSMFDYQRTGWFERKELLWILSVMSQPLDPEVREGYTFRDFTRWLFSVLDKDGDGFVTHEEFVKNIRGDATTQRAFRTMHLAPQAHHETNLRRKTGRRFMFVGHHHWDLVCCLMRGIELAVSKLKFVREENDIDPYEEIIRYDVESETLYSDPDIDWETNKPVPEWAVDYGIGTRVKLKNIEVDPKFNNKTGLVTGVDLKLGCLLVFIKEISSAFKVGPQNLQILRPAVSKSIVIHLQPGSDIGLSFQRRPDGMVFISGVATGSRAYHAGLKPGHVVESINHHRMSDIRVINSFLQDWRHSGSGQILFGVVIPDEGTDEDFAPGSRVQLVGLQNEADFNGKCGVVVCKDGENIQILLDESDTPNDVQATNLIPLTNAMPRRIKLIVPPGGDVGFDYESSGTGAVYVKSVMPKGPADKVGLPIRAVITHVNGASTPSALLLAKALEEWETSEQAEVVLDIMQPGIKLNNQTGAVTHTGSSSSVVLSDYCPRVFATIRSCLEISDEEYLHSVGLNTVKAGLFTAHFRGLWEMKPNAMWFSTHDERYIISGMSQESLEALMVMLPEYETHIQANNDTLINKYVGLHSIRWNGTDVYFSIMRNVFPAPHQEVGQVVSITPSTLNDWNKGVGLQGTDKEEILTRLHSDVDLLQRAGASEYVLVVGVHNVTYDDLKSAEGRIREAAEQLLGNPSWSVGKVLGSYQINKKLAPTFSRRHFAKLPPVDERTASQQHKAMLEEKFSPKKKPDNDKENQSPNPVPVRSKTPPKAAENTGWVCQHCSTRNGPRLVAKADPLRNRRRRRVTTEAAPVCAGCYRTAASPATMSAGDIVPLEGAPAKEDYVEQTYIMSRKVAPLPMTTYNDNSDASTEASEDEGKGPGSPSIPTRVRRKDLKKMPSDVANSVKRFEFQRRHGGYPGALIHKSGILSLVTDKKSNLFYFAIVDTLNSNYQHGTAEAYAQSFKKMLASIFV